MLPVFGRAQPMVFQKVEIELLTWLQPTIRAITEMERTDCNISTPAWIC